VKQKQFIRKLFVMNHNSNSYSMSLSSLVLIICISGILIFQTA